MNQVETVYWASGVWSLDDLLDYEPPTSTTTQSTTLAPKCKSDAAELSDDGDFEAAAASTSTAKKPRLSDKENATKGKGKAAAEKKAWTDITLDGEDDGALPVFDDCNEIRRKIRLLQKEPDFKACLALGSLRVELDVSQVTPWLKQIGGINSNSFQRFMKASGPQGGAENDTYKAAKCFQLAFYTFTDASFS
ncbi:hypothetical protein CPB85DRAFT_1433661 [Mucidula mucida]|nr:hypothetical protein CPB85DRAFT_1433661 [Mucidula mucida]